MLESKPRWRKVTNDLLNNKIRTTLVVLAIAIGVFAVGVIISTRSIVIRELNRTYQASNGASAIILTTPFSDELVQSVERVPAVATAEGRQSVRVQVNVGPNEWREMVLIGLSDYDDIAVNKIWPEAGKWPPDERELLVERTSLPYINSNVGDSLVIELGDGTLRQLPVVGSTHDISFPNAEFINLGFGYVTRETLDWLGSDPRYTELRFTVSEGQADAGHISAVVDEVVDKVERSGREVFSATVPPPGEHWAGDILDTLLLLLAFLGTLTLFLSGILVINTLNSVMAHHINHIGIYKLIGAQRRQILGMYLVMVLAYGVLALLISLPLSAIASHYFVDFIAGRVNIDISSYSVPPGVILAQVAVSLIVPLVAAAWPVLQGVQVTTYAALNDVGMGPDHYGRGLIDRLFATWQYLVGLPRPILISMRNMLRRKGRLALTLVALVLGSGLFISVMSVRESLTMTMDQIMDYHQYDVFVGFDRPYRVPKLQRAAMVLPGVERAETWGAATVQRVRPDGTNSETFQLLAPTPGTQFIRPMVMEGRWLRPNDTNAVVVDTAVTRTEDDLRLGDELVLDINGRESTWVVVGLVRGLLINAKIYTNYDSFQRQVGQPNQASHLYLGTSQHHATFQENVARTATAYFENTTFDANNVRTTTAMRDLLDTQMSLLVIFLLIMALLTAAVGGLGLTSTMSMNVMERTREIGVMRAVGASDRSVRQIVIGEGISVGLISWALGSLLALPMSRLLAEQVGLALMDQPLAYAFSFGGMFLWLAVVLVIATVASGYPALRASRLTIREVLAYE